MKLGFAPTHALEFHNVDCHPDLLALKHLIQQMETDQRRLMAGRIGIIIDSHLGNFPKIVSRELPVLDECYFPEWADLTYASDAAADSVPNMLLQASDRAASSLLRQIEGGTTDSISQIEQPDHASYFRVWHFSGTR